MHVQYPVFPALPERISRMRECAYNFWWSWHRSARELFGRLDRPLWRLSQHNPVQLLRGIDPGRLARMAEDSHFLALYDSVIAEFDEYMSSEHSWFSESHPQEKEFLVAYFCAEFGIHNALPIYSGGLGLLAGDTCKEASDLGIPMVAIGSLYPEGYFHQHIEADGRQEAIYTALDTDSTPILQVLREDGSRLQVSVPLEDTEVKVAIWKVQIGRVPVYLMDTNIEENEPWLRDVSARLYGGDQLARLRQEIILGMGGVRVLHALGYQPTVFHLNEGHAAFAAIELLREPLMRSESFDAALRRVRRSLVFTTHTPVKAGHDAFPFHLVEEYFHGYCQKTGLSHAQFLKLGQIDDAPSFSMTVLALRTSRLRTAVSRRQGEVSRQMWSELWPDREVSQVPIVPITNGVHVPTWISPELVELLERHLGLYWWLRHDDPAFWEKVDLIPAKEIWEVHLHLKQRMLALIRKRARLRWLRGGASCDQIVALGTLLDSEVLTLGFARRFATYKRATLIFRDMERLKRILKNPRKPVQIIFSGKAHPADEPGKFLLQQVFQAAASRELEGHIAFVENYDKHVAHRLVTGTDVWLNNPLPPMEASGTSGQKASLNGVPNLSVRDGWWYEGYNGRNGWAIEGEDDESTANSLYDLLENQVVPLFYERDTQGIPQQWVALMKETIRSVAALFSARRMVKEYTRKIYVAPFEESA
ncbi:MAG: alpha-glucan family phosphorylase [Acidobacteriota bacterium]